MINLKNSLGIRLIIIAFLSLVLLIPAVLIQEVIREREQRRDSVAGEISQKWGAEQAVTGPLLTIPYKHYYKSGDNIEHTIRYAHFLPDKLTVEGTVTPEVRYRGIFEVIVYSTELSISGVFPAIELNGFKVAPEDFLVEDAFVSVGISDMTGIREFVTIVWNGSRYVADPGIESGDVLESGISISPGITASEEQSFDFQLKLNGSSSLLFSPAGKQTEVRLSSGWSNPSFTGNFLPVEREVTASGFSSEWKVLHLNRNFPQQWLGVNREVAQSLFGVELLLPVDEYRKTMRTAKYAIMFISLTFLTFFMIELLSKKTIHPVQYLLIGFALLVFYTLLLSLSEYMAFGAAYLIASAAVIVLISVYTYSVLADKAKTGIISGVLVILYGYLYILLQLQDFALLMGSTGLFAVLATVMYLTRNINWFDIMGSNKQAAVKPGPSGG